MFIQMLTVYAETREEWITSLSKVCPESLELAAQYGYAKLVEKLIDNGAKITDGIIENVSRSQ